MSYDRFLTYLSEKGSGDWNTWRESWQWLTGDSLDPAEKAWIVAQDLSALGHIEVAWSDPIKWCAAPPVLTMIPRSGGRALLTGSRTRALYEPSESPGELGTGALVDVADELDLWVDEWRSPSRPTTALLACETAGDAEKAARLLGITYTYSVADQLARLLPPLSAYVRLWEPGDLPRGFDRESFDCEALRWTPAPDVEAQGLYRCRTYQNHVHAINGPTGWRRVLREHAVYEVLRWSAHQVMTYDAEAMELVVPVHARLPILHARAAILSSGRLPRVRRERGQAVLVYVNVDAQLAELIAGSLDQDLAVDGHA